MNPVTPYKIKDKVDIKIFILYLMQGIGYPLSFHDLNDIAVTDGVIGCIEFAECFGELLDAGNIREVKSGAGNGDSEDKKQEILYELTPKGVYTAGSLQSKLLSYLRERSLKSAVRLLNLKKNGGGISTEKERRADGRFDVHCVAFDGKGNRLMDLTLIADTDAGAEKIRDNFNERPEHIYRAVYSVLTGEADFLFDL